MNYRAEIDGLRALAVIPVILFHAGFELFSGGFVGVDIFFVISGYLITTILVTDIEKNRFSLANFYERRARRILPALFVVMFACIPFAWMWMLPTQLKDFAQSLAAVPLFVSNIFFWSESGYFESEAEEKPLLHTWSLAVEEQYYLLFPLLLLFGWRFGKDRVFYTIIGLGLLSLLVSEWGWRNAPDANFYLIPARAWELFAGSIAAFIVLKHGVRANNILASIGLLAILLAIFLYDESTPFPSLYALLPVLGVVLLILFAERETMVAKCLSAKPLVGLGLISYSAYLWHQPLFAFARLKSMQHPSAIIFAVLIVVTFLLAFLSWKYIEQPFRNKNKFNRRFIFRSAAVIGVAFICISIAERTVEGAGAYRFSAENWKVISTAMRTPFKSKCHFPEKESALSREACRFFEGDAKVAVFGDSHASELAYALASELKPYNTALVQHSISRCWHNYAVEAELDTICQRWHAKVLGELVSDQNITSVVLSYRNEEYLHDEIYRNSLLKMISDLIDVNKRVVLVLQAPLPGAHIDKYFAANIGNLQASVAGLSEEEWRRHYFATEVLKNTLPHNVQVVDPAEAFCREGQCYVSEGGVARYFDDNHMSVAGARIVTQQVLSLLGF